MEARATVRSGEDLGSLLLVSQCGVWGVVVSQALHSDLGPEDGVSRGAELFPLFVPSPPCPGVSETQAEHLC